MAHTAEEKCKACGGDNPVWSANNELWNKVNGSPNGILCPTCFVKMANEAGIKMFGIKPQQEEGWISVEDGLPDFTDKGYAEEFLLGGAAGVFFGLYDGKDFHSAYLWAQGHKNPLSGVTHWMPLPKPPQQKVKL